jgi:hypothetical protein
MMEVKCPRERGKHRCSEAAGDVEGDVRVVSDLVGRISGEGGVPTGREGGSAVVGPRGKLVACGDDGMVRRKTTNCVIKGEGEKVGAESALPPHRPRCASSSRDLI